MKNDKTRCIRVEGSPTFGFQNWSTKAQLRLEDKIKEYVEAIVREGSAIATDEYKVLGWLPAEYDNDRRPTDGFGNAAPADPLTIYVELPLGTFEYEGPLWSVSLSELIDGLIDTVTDGKKGSAKKPYHRMLRALRDRLRLMADRVDNTLPHHLNAVGDGP